MFDLHDSAYAHSQSSTGGIYEFTDELLETTFEMWGPPPGGPLLRVVSLRGLEEDSHLLIHV